MTNKESESCIQTIELLRTLAYNVHGVMDVVDHRNCNKIIRMLEDQHWINCKEEMPDPGKDVILFFRDTYHKHSDWDEYTVMPAWICNVDPEMGTPDGEWAISGRYGGSPWVQPLDTGIAWMQMPEAPSILVSTNERSAE